MSPTNTIGVAKTVTKSCASRPSKTARLLSTEANRCQKYKSATQPGRVRLSRIGHLKCNRGGQGVLPTHSHGVARDICLNTTSTRRYLNVGLVKIPDEYRKEWFALNESKAKMNPMLPRFKAMSHTDTVFATLNCTHFCSAQQLIDEGGRRFYDLPDGIALTLRADDEEGQIIQDQGVMCTVYEPELLDDIRALNAIMQEDNMDAAIQKVETEFDSFGLANIIVNEMTKNDEANRKKISVDDVMAELAKLGHGNMSVADWRHLVHFRLMMPNVQAGMLFDCLVQVCQGRVTTKPETYGHISNLHANRHPWVKAFILMETYAAQLLDETTGLACTFNHAGPQAKIVQTLDPKAIKLVGREKEFLLSVGEFFGAVVKKYYPSEEAEGESAEKKMLANATLMKALGRLVWKVAMALLAQTRKVTTAEGAAPVIGDDKATQNLINKMMKGAFALVEDRYVGHLENAGVVFSISGERPAPLHPRTKEPDAVNGTSAMSHSQAKDRLSHGQRGTTLPGTASEVRLLSDGGVISEVTAKDVIKQLGLTGTGIGQDVGVRNKSILAQSRLPCIATKVTIVSLNPPEVTIQVEGKIQIQGTEQLVSKKVTVDVDDLVPVDSVKASKTDPLDMGYDSKMPRVPKFDYVDNQTSWMKSCVQSTNRGLAAASAESIAAQVEVVLVDSSQGVMHCRTTRPISRGTLRLYPYGGELVPIDDVIERNRVEQSFSVKDGYMKALELVGTVKALGKLWNEDFIMYSAMSHKPLPLLTVDSDDRVVCARHFSPFWAVMLVGRDSTHMVNMAPYMEEYSIPHAVAKQWGVMKVGSRVSVSIPFLSNTRDLNAGELLALPYDGGHKSIFCAKIPPAKAK